MRSELVVGDACAVIDAADGGLLTSLTVGGVDLVMPEPRRVNGIPHYGSFVLAPWVGEMFHGRLRYGGQEHRLPLRGNEHAVHGLVYDVPWGVRSSTQDSLELMRGLGEPWPFGGEVRQHFALDPAGLTQRVSVTAADATMPVGFGWHPWFTVPADGETRLVVEATHYAELDAELIPTGRVLPLDEVAHVSASGGGFVVGSATIDMVLVDVNGPAQLIRPDRTIEIAYDPKISTLVVYATETSICIEPWTSWPDAVRGRRMGLPTGVIDLGPGQSVERWMRWSWGDDPGPREG